MIKKLGWVIEQGDGETFAFGWYVTTYEETSGVYDLVELAKEQNRYVKLPEGWFLQFANDSLTGSVKR